MPAFKELGPKLNRRRVLSLLSGTAAATTLALLSPSIVSAQKPNRYRFDYENAFLAAARDYGEVLVTPGQGLASGAFNLPLPENIFNSMTQPDESERDHFPLDNSIFSWYLYNNYDQSFWLTLSLNQDRKSRDEYNQEVTKYIPSDLIYARLNPEINQAHHLFAEWKDWKFTQLTWDLKDLPYNRLHVSPR